MPGRSVDILINARDNATPALNSAGASAKKAISDFNSLKNMVMAGLGGVGVRSIINFGTECVKAFAESGKEGLQLKKGLEALSKSWHDLKVSIGETIAQPVTPWLQQMNLELRKSLGLSGQDATKAEGKLVGEQFVAGPGRFDIALQEMKARRAQLEAERVAAQGRADVREAAMNFARLVPGGEIGNRIGQGFDLAAAARAQEQIDKLDKMMADLVANRQKQMVGPINKGQGAIADPILKGLFDVTRGFSKMHQEGVLALDDLIFKMDRMAIAGRKLAEINKELQGKADKQLDQRQGFLGGIVGQAWDIFRMRQMGIIDNGQMGAMGLGMGMDFVNQFPQKELMRNRVFGSDAMRGTGGSIRNDIFESRGLTMRPNDEQKPELKTLQEIKRVLDKQLELENRKQQAIDSDPATAKQILEIRNQLG